MAYCNCMCILTRTEKDTLQMYVHFGDLEELHIAIVCAKCEKRPELEIFSTTNVYHSVKK